LCHVAFDRLSNPSLWQDKLDFCSQGSHDFALLFGIFFKMISLLVTEIFKQNGGVSRLSILSLYQIFKMAAICQF